MTPSVRRRRSAGSGTAGIMPSRTAGLSPLRLWTPHTSQRRRCRLTRRRCEVCGVHKRSGLNPAVLLGMMPAVPLPADLRRRTLGVIADKTPTAVAYRARVLDRAARFGAGGFPAQVATPSVPGRRVTAVAAVAAAAAALALLGGAMYFAAHAS